MNYFAFDAAYERLRECSPAIIAFDADYTLWADDIGYAAWNEAMLRQMLRPEARESLAEELRALGSLPREEPHADGRQLMELEAMGAVDADVLVSFMATAFAGFSPTELEEFGFEIARTRLKGAIYEGLRDFLSALTELGHELIIVSASAQELVRGASRGFELPIPTDRIFGVQTKLDQSGNIGPRAIEPVCHEAGKVVRLNTELDLSKVIAAASDSASDLPLLNAASHLKMAVNPSDELRDHVDEDDNWLLIRPLRDEKGRVVTRYPDTMWV